LNDFKSEREIQDLLIAAIDADELAQIIADDAGMRSLASDTSEDQLPSFSIDHLSRLASARAGTVALDSLSFLQRLTDDENMSITSGEILRPDIVALNAERETLILFELKKTSQTGRQALTELLAYEHELKNVLPFLSNYDVVFVLVSPEWSTLMDHSAASAAAWSGKNILCLEAKLSNGALSLHTRIPEAWRITGSVYFPEDALPSVTVCLYDERSSEETGDSEGLDHRLWTALQIIAREGDRLGGHGFAFLWRDHWSGSQTTHNLTVCGVSPFAFYTAMRTRGRVGEGDGRLIAALDHTWWTLTRAVIPSRCYGQPQQLIPS
jgi:hypothetical protein